MSEMTGDPMSDPGPKEVLTLEHGQRKRGYFTRFLLIYWVLLILGGVFYLIRYTQTPGPSAELRSIDWPVGTYLKSPNGVSGRFIAFLHPRCACSAATLTEVERLLVRFKNKVTATVVFIRPNQASDEWVKGRLWERAMKIANLETVIDDGTASALFKPRTSGQTYLFDREGKLVFEGGITPSRGHEGDSPGREFILNWLSGEDRRLANDNVKHAHVFGCILQSRNSKIENEK